VARIGRITPSITAQAFIQLPTAQALNALMTTTKVIMLRLVIGWPIAIWTLDVRLSHFAPPLLRNERRRNAGRACYAGLPDGCQCSK